MLSVDTTSEASWRPAIRPILMESLEMCSTKPTLATAIAAWCREGDKTTCAITTESRTLVHHPHAKDELKASCLFVFCAEPPYTPFSQALRASTGVRGMRGLVATCRTHHPTSLFFGVSVAVPFRDLLLSPALFRHPFCWSRLLAASTARPRIVRPCAGQSCPQPYHRTR